ncbi:unnamed protein product, partial [Iphiclides podalirius]
MAPRCEPAVRDTARIERTLFPETAQHCWSEGYWRDGEALAAGSRRYSARSVCQVGGASASAPSTVNAHSPRRCPLNAIKRLLHH